MKNYLLTLSFLMIIPFLAIGQNICQPASVEDHLMKRKIKTALNDMVNKIMRQTCPITGKNSYYQIDVCESIATYTNNGITYEDCTYLEVRMGFDGWTCLWEASANHYVFNTVLIFQKDKIINELQDYIELNEAFAYAEQCNILIQATLKDGLEGMFQEMIRSLNGN